MGEDQVETEPPATEEDAALPDLTPWRHAGWIFRDGDCVAIERQGDEVERRSRVLAD